MVFGVPSGLRMRPGPPATLRVFVFVTRSVAVSETEPLLDDELAAAQDPRAPCRR